MVLAFILPPLIGFFLNAFRFQSSNKKLSGILGVSSCFLSFLSVVSYIWLYGFTTKSFFVLPWFNVGDLSLNFSFVLDSLSLLMSLLITGVASLIHLYSWSYMSKDHRASPVILPISISLFL